MLFIWRNLLVFLMNSAHTKKNLPIPDLTLKNRGSEMIRKKSKNRPINRDRRLQGLCGCYEVYVPLTGKVPCSSRNSHIHPTIATSYSHIPHNCHKIPMSTSNLQKSAFVASTGSEGVTTAYGNCHR